MWQRGCLPYDGRSNMEILLVEDDPAHAAIIGRVLRRSVPDHRLVQAASEVEALRAGSRVPPPSLVLLDLGLPDGGGIELVRNLRARPGAPPVVVVTATDSARAAMAALRAGACEYIVKDPEMETALEAAVRRVLRSNPASHNDHDELGPLVGRSRVMAELRSQIKTAAATDAPVLLEGETGTGKELTARAIHAASHRRVYPFIPVNAATIPDSIAESELFGHTRGAFTGAVRERTGLIEAANRGSLFLDEIEDLTPALQAKLLRVVQDREFRRLGTTRMERADVRVIAATNRDVRRMVERGGFRADLYYRLSVFAIRVPALRERLDDVPLLTAHFVRRFNARYGTSFVVPPGAALRRLTRYSWPGNVRELENLIERTLATALATGQKLEELLPQVVPGSAELGLCDERHRILAALEEHRWNRHRTARALGISRVTLWRRMERLGIHDPLLAPAAPGWHAQQASPWPAPRGAAPGSPCSHPLPKPGGPRQ